MIEALLWQQDLADHHRFTKFVTSEQKACWVRMELYLIVARSLNKTGNNHVGLVVCELVLLQAIKSDQQVPPSLRSAILKINIWM